MIYLYIVLGILFALFMTLLFLPLRIYIEYQNKQIKLEIKFLKLKFDLKKYIDKPKKSKKLKAKHNKKGDTDTDKQLTVIQKINNSYKKIVYLKRVYTDSSKTINRGIITENIQVDVYFGFSDAAVTGMVTGLVWSLLYEFLGLISIITTVENHKFNVDSVYDRFIFELGFSVTFKTKIASILKILFSVLYNLNKYKE